MTMREWIAALPKLDLHCHLDGSLSPRTVRALARESGVELPAGQAELLALLQAKDDCRSLAEYLKRFELPLRCLRSRNALRLATLGLLEEAHAENVRYIEIRFAPLLSEWEGLSSEDAVEGVLEGIREAQTRYGITASAILCCMRHFPTEANLRTVRLAARYLGNGVCAVDLAGDEAAFPTSAHREMFQLAKALGIPYTIHAGECGSLVEVEEALALDARRIGHGIALQSAPHLLAECARRRVTTELCPVSNLQTKAVRGWADYPLRLFLSAGLPATINTDNRTVSGTSLTKEFTLLHEHLALTPPEMRLLCENAIEAAFADASVKSRLRGELAAIRALPT